MSKLNIFRTKTEYLKLKCIENITQFFFCYYSSNQNFFLASFSFEEKNRNYEMSSFDEKQATTLLKERPIEFVNYNKHQLSRVYPAGTRFDSSNFNPQVSVLLLKLKSHYCLFSLIPIECRQTTGCSMKCVGFYIKSVCDAN